jgi:hypothetical protein
MANPDSSNLVKQLWMGGLQESQSAIVFADKEPVIKIAANPALPSSHTLDKFYSTDTYDEPGGGKSKTEVNVKQPWYKHHLFLQSVAVVVVFLVSFIMLVSIRPPFLYTKPEDELHKSEFSAARAAWISLGAAAVAVIAMLIIYFAAQKQSGSSKK